MTLREARCRFSLMISCLIKHAHDLGYECAIDCVKCYLPGHHMKNSLHYEGLAADINLYKGGIWLQDGTGHDILHSYWSKLGGAEMIPWDLNHYSIEWQGRR